METLLPFDGKKSDVHVYTGRTRKK